MMRTRILAAATAAVLMLGMSVGGAGAAFADESSPAVETPIVEAPEESTLVESPDSEESPAVVGPVAPLGAAAANNGPAPHPDGGANKVTVCHATPPDTAANGWNLLSIDDDAAATNQSGHDSEHDADIIEAFSYWHKVGNGNSATWELRSYPGKNLTTDFGGKTGAEILANDCVKPEEPPVDPTCVVVVWEMPSWNTSTRPTWPQSLVSVHETDCTTPISEEDIPVPDECGTQYQLDKYFESETTTSLINGGFLNGPNNPQEDLIRGGWGVAYMLVQNPDCELATAAVSVDPRDCFVGTALVITPEASSNVTWGDPIIAGGTISITATADPGSLFEEGLSGVSDDRTQRTFEEPYEPAGGDDCVAPSIDVVAAFTQLTCDPDSGSFTVGLFDPADPNADKLLWTTTAGTVPSATANTVSEPGVVTVTVRVANAHLGDFAVSETSSLGTVSNISVDGVETALITWTFTFTEPDDCELGNVVVPIVSATDFCEGVGPNALRVATFTVTDVEHVTYQYRVNDGSLIGIDFDGEETVTIAVSPLDVVEVVATPLGDFQLPEDWAWSYTFLESAFCPGTFPATEASAVITPADCDGNMVVVTLSNEGGVIWTLNGAVVEGNTTHQLVPGSAVQLTAALEGPTDENPGGWTWSNPNQQTSWSYDGMSDEDCLSNLAFTGADSATEWLGAAAVIMMLVGMGALARRRRVEA